MKGQMTIIAIIMALISLVIYGLLVDAFTPVLDVIYADADADTILIKNVAIGLIGIMIIVGVLYYSTPRYATK